MVNDASFGDSKALLEDLLRCPICDERYSIAGLMVPKVLGCGHSFCITCAANALRIQPECPICRTEQTLLKGVSVTNMLPTNWALYNIIENLYPAEQEASNATAASDQADSITQPVPELPTPRRAPNMREVVFQATVCVSFDGHRVRRWPDGDSEQIGTVLFRTTPTIVFSQSRIDGLGRHWKKVHPEMFPRLQSSPLFVDHDPLREGWCMVQQGDIIYFTKESGQMQRGTLSLRPLLEALGIPSNRDTVRHPDGVEVAATKMIAVGGHRVRCRPNLTAPQVATLQPTPIHEVFKVSAHAVDEGDNVWLLLHSSESVMLGLAHDADCWVLAETPGSPKRLFFYPEFP